MARNSLCIIDEYTERKDLTRLQKWRLRHPEQAELARQYTKEYLEQNPDHVRNWRKNNRQKYNENEAKGQRRRLLKKRGLTEISYQELLDSQNNSCAICKGPPTGNKDWSIDHCHETNKTRGILCGRCNSMLGFAKDSTNILQSAIEYLIKYGK